MSKYMTFTEVAFKDPELLIAALEEIGCKQIKKGNDLEMGSYYSEQSKQKVEIVIPRVGAHQEVNKFEQMPVLPFFQFRSSCRSSLS